MSEQMAASVPALPFANTWAASRGPFFSLIAASDAGSGRRESADELRKNAMGAAAQRRPPAVKVIAPTGVAAAAPAGVSAPSREAASATPAEAGVPSARRRMALFMQDSATIVPPCPA